MEKSTRTGSKRVSRSTIVARWRYACDGRVLDVAAVRLSECGVLTGSVNTVNECMRVEGHQQRYRVSKARALSLDSNEGNVSQLTNTVLPLVYTIFSLLALSLVDCPRVVEGLAAYIATLVNDIFQPTLRSISFDSTKHYHNISLHTYPFSPHTISDGLSG